MNRRRYHFMTASKGIAKWTLAASLMLALAVLPKGFALAATSAGGINPQTFSGRYVTSYHGFDSSITGTVSEPNPPAIPYSVSGALTSDGRGNVIGFENGDYGSPGTGSSYTCDITGTYTVAQAHNLMNGMITLNLAPTCASVTCSGTTTPSCAPGSYTASSPSQWFCAMSGPSGKSLVCTEMGEAASNTTNQDPISAATWEKKEP